MPQSADRGSAYLELADEAICVGPARAADSYLKIANVISAAEVGNVEAIHPGYGFLAENAHFNEICRSCRIDFIGPSPEAMERLGDKNQARNLARSAQVPVVPGSEGLIEDEYALQEQDDAVEAIAWIAAQPWCSGAVGMTGISWGGFNSLQVAARRPPALKAIITHCSTDDRYADVEVDLNKSMEVYREWLALARPAPGPDNLRRPLWFSRAVRPADEVYRVGSD